MTDLLKELLWNVVLPTGLTVASIIVPAVAVWGAKKLVRVFEEKTRIDLSAETEAFIDKTVRRGVRVAEEFARQQLKDHSEITGSEKLNLATTKVRGLLIEAGVDMSKSEIEDRVHSALAKMRLEKGA